MDSNMLWMHRPGLVFPNDSRIEMEKPSQVVFLQTSLGVPNLRQLQVGVLVLRAVSGLFEC